MNFMSLYLTCNNYPEMAFNAFRGKGGLERKIPITSVNCPTKSKVLDLEEGEGRSELTISIYKRVYKQDKYVDKCSCQPFNYLTSSARMHIFI